MVRTLNRVCTWRRHRTKERKDPEGAGQFSHDCFASIGDRESSEKGKKESYLVDREHEGYQSVQAMEGSRADSYHNCKVQYPASLIASFRLKGQDVSNLDTRDVHGAGTYVPFTVVARSLRRVTNEWRGETRTRPCGVDRNMFQPL